MSTQPKLGVELELWIVDEHGRLTGGDGLVDAHERIEPEFVDPLVEVRTEPHDSEADLRRDLQEVLGTALEAATSRGRHLVPLGTPLTTADVPATTDRGAVFERIYGDGIRSAKNCAGTHVHFETGDVLEQLQLLTALDPALALVSSSPYYCSERGMQSSRAHAYRNACGEPFQRYCGLWEYPDSVAAWRERVDDVFETFCAIASDRGVDRSTVEKYFTPEDTVLNPVRLRECQPTVEWRAPDATLPSQVLQLATDVRSLMGSIETTPLQIGGSDRLDGRSNPAGNRPGASQSGTAPRGRRSEIAGRFGASDGRITVPDFDRLQDLSRRAIRAGIESAPVRSYLQTLGFDVTDYDPIAPQIRGPSTISRARARQLRLEYAAALREDVESLDEGETGDAVEASGQQIV